jgi:hypothetical protein
VREPRQHALLHLTLTMATYLRDIAELPALASGVDDAPAAEIAIGDAVAIAHVGAASRQYKNRKRLAEMPNPRATDFEVADSKRRKRLVESCNFDGPIPAWADPMNTTLQAVVQGMTTLQAQMQTLQAQMQTLQAQMQAMTTSQAQMQAQMQGLATNHQLQAVRESVDRLGWGITAQTQRSANRARCTDTVPIARVIRLADGTAPCDPLWFPVTHMQWLGATGANVTALLAFYGLAVDGPLIAKKLRLGTHLGVVPPS